MIEPDAEALPEPEGAVRLAGSRAANVPVVVHDDYAGDFNPAFRLESLSAPALETAMDEACLQGHLLARAFMTTVADRDGPGEAVAIGHKQLTGIAGVVARRLARLGLDMAAVFDLHPAFRPRLYVDWNVVIDDGAVIVSLGECEGLREGDDMAWPALLAAHPDAHPALAAIAHAVDPRACVEAAGERTWRITVDPDGAPAKEASEVTLTRVSTGADFEFGQR